ncbi:TetR/AcrR family transcriptional regulator [Nocardia otitidiscaviarum]|uniref:TetR/AcrR family transcriptional regulator n=1 Tax=Nocardia otitidiscaviarum TaxID=1823 RepID=UPI001895FA6F|nr:TetR/AcrR family transcriptional regulator [Nocardia otitidiscaviarum]MBF6182466.1 TetR/AcrR family transcriptional regulator [Nocardia otitidiscaviarum]
MGAASTRGRIDKRQQILAAAFAVFAQRGYAQTCVQEVADAAGVAKPTVYNHLTDKASLFREALLATAEAVSSETLAAVDTLRDFGDDPQPTFVDSAYRLLQACSSERGRSLHRLAYAQADDFADLAAEIQQRTAIRLREALADRLARLILAGHVRPSDPDVAAEQYLALLTGPLEIRSRLGARKVPAAELRAIAEAATDTFLRAYAPD